MIGETVLIPETPPDLHPEPSPASYPQMPHADADRDRGAVPAAEEKASAAQREVGGRDGPDPTRYGDWEKNGRCIDF